MSCGPVSHINNVSNEAFVFSNIARCSTEEPQGNFMTYQHETAHHIHRTLEFISPAKDVQGPKTHLRNFPIVWCNMDIA